jgi:hypothetical protein
MLINHDRSFRCENFVHGIPNARCKSLTSDCRGHVLSHGHRKAGVIRVLHPPQPHGLKSAKSDKT